MGTIVRLSVVACFISLTLFAAGSAVAQEPTFKMLIGSDVSTDVDKLQGPTGVAIHNGELYVVEQGHKEISIFTLEGVYQRKFSVAGSQPEKVAIDAAGNCYLTDGLDNVVRKYDAAGNYLLEWGGTGSGDGELNTPLGITLDADGDIWVNDRFNYRFVEYDTEGNQLSATPRDVFDNTGATDIVFGPDGLIYATMWAQNYNRVSVFNTAGEMQRFSTTVRGPQGIGLAPNGRIGVVTWEWHRAHLLEADDPMGEVVSWGGQGGNPEQFSYPLDIVFDNDGDIYICDKSLGRVKVFTSMLVPTQKTSFGSLRAMYR